MEGRFKYKTGEIIINGVDVSKCNYFIDKWVYYDDYTEETIDCEFNCCGCGTSFLKQCEEIKNCYYKQLKRMEIENNKLKQALKAIEESE